jgi:hypothetical protein
VWQVVIGWGSSAGWSQVRHQPVVSMSVWVQGTWPVPRQPVHHSWPLRVHPHCLVSVVLMG